MSNPIRKKILDSLPFKNSAINKLTDSIPKKVLKNWTIHNRPSLPPTPVKDSIIVKPKTN